MDDDEVPMDKLAKIYQKIRARVQALTTEYETQVDELKAQQQEVANEMKNRMQKLGMASVRTTEGTIVLGQKTRFFTSDWDSFKQFVLEHEVLDLFEKRIAQGNMKQFLEENPGVVPPGLNSDSEVTITVRKPTK
jgi:DNA-binding ferritin-like protein (Dps family)